MENFYVYMLKCNDGSFYIGHTDNLEKRLFEHNNKNFNGYTSKRLPVELVYYQLCNLREEAFAVERKIKGWSRNKKEALITNNWDKIAILSKKKFEK